MFLIRFKTASVGFANKVSVQEGLMHMALTVCNVRRLPHCLSYNVLMLN